MFETSLSGKRVVVFVGHPGHELRIFRLLELTRPLVHVLTDGSGSKGVNRTASTMRILEQTGATPGSIFGRFSDGDIYAAILAQDMDLFQGLVDEFAASLVEQKAEVVVGDMLEGYNSSHDVCRILIGAAITKCRKEHGMEILNLDFPLMGLPARYGNAEGAISITTDEEDFARKLSAAENYPELKQEVDAAIGQLGTAPFMAEVVRPVSDEEGVEWNEPEPPYYETYGEKQVAAGHYKYVIRYREHIQPIAQAVRGLVLTG